MATDDDDKRLGAFPITGGQMLIPPYADQFHLNVNDKADNGLLNLFFLREPYIPPAARAQIVAAGVIELPIAAAVSLAPHTALRIVRILAEHLGYSLVRRAGGN